MIQLKAIERKRGKSSSDQPALGMICLSPKPSSEKKKPLYIVCSVRRLNKILGGHPGISSHYFGEDQLSCQLFTTQKRIAIHKRKEAS